jgi:hypothetical protein
MSVYSTSANCNCRCGASSTARTRERQLVSPGNRPRGHKASGGARRGESARAPLGFYQRSGGARAIGATGLL